MNQVVRVPLRKRATIRSTAQALKIPKSTLFNYIQRSKMKRHSTTVKPHLTLANMVEREEFCKSFIKDDKSTSDDMLDAIHVDEKVFYIIWACKNTNRIVQQEANSFPPR